MAAPRRVLLIRHGETAGESSVRYHGSNDVPLSDLGRSQIRALAPLLAGCSPAAVWHSPLVRAAESAAILAESLAWPRSRLVADHQLREISFGACEGLSGPEIAAAHPGFWQAHSAGRATAFPEGEPFADFAVRVRAAIARLVAASTDGDLVVVAHRGVVRHALRLLLATPADAPDEFTVALGSLTVVRPGRPAVLERFNATGVG